MHVQTVHDRSSTHRGIVHDCTNFLFACQTFAIRPCSRKSRKLIARESLSSYSRKGASQLSRTKTIRLSTPKTTTGEILIFALTSPLTVEGKMPGSLLNQVPNIDGTYPFRTQPCDFAQQLQVTDSQYSGDRIE